MQVTMGEPALFVHVGAADDTVVAGSNDGSDGDDRLRLVGPKPHADADA